VLWVVLCARQQRLLFFIRANNYNNMELRSVHVLLASFSSVQRHDTLRWRRSYSCGLFRVYCFVPLNFTLSGTICSSVELKSSGTSWDSFHETKQAKAWSSIYCSHNAAEEQCSETCFCSCLQQMHADFLFHKLLTSPRVVVLIK